MTKAVWVNRLTEWRERAGLSVTDAAKALGLTRHVYEQCELGTREPGATALLLIPRAFGISKKESQQLLEVA